MTTLADLGYEYVPATDGRRGHFLLRKIGNPDVGFEWAGKENFAALGRATFLWARQQLVDLCGLKPLCAIDPPATAYASPDIATREAPVLVLITGDVPGGDAGVWSRNLSINQDTLKGCMFPYIFRAQELGWSVLIVDPHNSPASQHEHLLRLWRGVIQPSKATKMLVVGHSYGGPVAMGMLKADPSACERLGALVTTDGMAWGISGWDTIEQLDESVPPASALESLSAENLDSQGGAEAVREMFDRCRRYAEITPAAFQTPSLDVVKCVADVGRNYRASAAPVGTPLRVTPEDVILSVSAGHETHGMTNVAPFDHIFEFLEQGANGAAAKTNETLRAAARADHVEVGGQSHPINPPLASVL